MESFKEKYVQACFQLKLPPNDAILHAIRDSNKKNKSQESSFVLNLAGCNLSATDSTVLSKCFATDSFIEEYRFTDCLLSEESCKIILNSLCFNKTIKVLDLKGNNLRSSGAELIGKLLKRTSLVELFLEWNSVGMWDTGLTAVAEGLALNQTLRVLDLSNNQISHQGGEEIAHALKRNKQLRVLDMRWNNVGVAGGRAFLNALSHNKYIVSLELAGLLIFLSFKLIFVKIEWVVAKCFQTLENPGHSGRYKVKCLSIRNTQVRSKLIVFSLKI